MPNGVWAVIIALLSAGFGLSILSMLRGVDLFRGRTAKTEAQGVALLERGNRELEWARDVAVHRLEYYRDELGPWKDSRIADLERTIRVELGRDKLPPLDPKPLMRALPMRSAALKRGDTDGDERPAPDAPGSSE